MVLIALGVFAWLIAAFYVYKAIETAKNIRRIPDILEEPQLTQQSRSSLPSMTVIVPAKNEGEDLGATLASLLGSDYPRLSIVAVDDRSSDKTGAIMDSFAAKDARLQVIHVTELPPGWMGKPHAMYLAARNAASDWLLFTDGDILFAPEILSRAVAHAQNVGADHLVVLPTCIMNSVGERSMLGFVQTTAGLLTRMWRVADPKAKRDIVGMGAFNMIRRSVYESIGGFEGAPMEVLEDIRLGRRVKQAGFAQRVAVAPEMVRLRWAVGGIGLALNLTKNLFALCAFRWWVAAGACALLLVVYPGAFIGLIAGLLRWHFLIAPCGLVVLSLLVIAQKYRRLQGVRAFYVFTYPIAAIALALAIATSVILTWVRGGVLWRGTLYPLRELRKHATPLF